MWHDKSGWYLEQLNSHGRKVLPPGAMRQAALNKVGEQLTADWLKKAGADGEAVIASLNKRTKSLIENTPMKGLWRSGL